MSPLNFRYVLQKNADELMRYDRLKFKTDFKSYIADCTALVTKIDNKELGHDDIIKIVSFYNSACGSMPTK